MTINDKRCTVTFRNRVLSTLVIVAQCRAKAWQASSDRRERHGVPVTNVSPAAR